MHYTHMNQRAGNSESGDRKACSSFASQKCCVFAAAREQWRTPQNLYCGRPLSLYPGRLFWLHNENKWWGSCAAAALHSASSIPIWMRSIRHHRARTQSSLSSDTSQTGLRFLNEFNWIDLGTLHRTSTVVPENSNQPYVKLFTNRLTTTNRRRDLSLESVWTSTAIITIHILTQKCFFSSLYKMRQSWGKALQSVFLSSVSRGWTKMLKVGSCSALHIQALIVTSSWWLGRHWQPIV